MSKPFAQWALATVGVVALLMAVVAFRAGDKMWLLIDVVIAAANFSLLWLSRSIK